MKKKYVSKCLLIGITSLVASTISFSSYASLSEDAHVLVNGAMNTSANVDVAADTLSLQAVQLGKNTHYGSYAISPKMCSDEASSLFSNAQIYLQKAMNKQYKEMGSVDGNKVMLVLGGASKITSIALMVSHVCDHGGKDTAEAYAAAYILNQSLVVGDRKFS